MESHILKRLEQTTNLKKRQIIISGFMLQVENFQRIFSNHQI